MTRRIFPILFILPFFACGGAEPCTIQSKDGVSVLVCPDGSEAALEPGKDGVDGEKGDQGPQGPEGPEGK